MNRWTKRIGIALSIPVALLLLISVSLYIPPLQEFAKEKAMAYASSATGMDISIGRIYLSFPLNLQIKEIQVVAPPTDTLFVAEQINISIKLLPLLKQEVAVNAVDIKQVRVNTGALIDGITIQGVLGKLHLTADQIDLATEEALINEVILSDTRITIHLNDTTETSDTVSTSIDWKIKLQAVALERVSVALNMQADSMRMTTYIPNASLKNGLVALAQQQYGAGQFKVSNASLSYQVGDGAAVSTGLDPSNLEFTHLNIAIDSVMNRGMEVTALIKELAFREHSGLEVTSLHGQIRMDSTALTVDNLILETPYSTVSLSAQAALSAFNKEATGQLGLLLNASIGKEDVFTLLGTVPADFQKGYPSAPFTLNTTVDGNMNQLHLRTCDAELPGAFKLHASGKGERVLDSLHRSAEISLKGKTENLRFLLAALDTASRKQFAIPQGITLHADATLAAGQYRGRLAVQERKGLVTVGAQYDSRRLSYGVQLSVDSMQLEHFLPHDSVRLLTASVTAKGQGTDFFSSATSATIEGSIQTLQYNGLPISGVTLTGSLQKNEARFVLNSTFQPATMHIALDGSIFRKKTAGTLTVDVGNLDLQALHLLPDSATTSFLFQLDAESDLKQAFWLGGKLSNWKVTTPGKTTPLKDIVFTAKSTSDTTSLHVQAGDLLVKLAGDNAVSGLNAQLNKFTIRLVTQLEKKALNLEELRPMLPELQLQITAGKDNPVYNYLSLSNVSFNSLAVNLKTSPTDGLNGAMGIYSLGIDTLQLDTVRLALQQDTLGITYQGGIINNAANKQHVFDAGVTGFISSRRGEALFRFTDGNGQTGLLLGLRAMMEPQGLALHFYPDDPVVAFRTFTLNPDNRILLGNDKNITANFRMEGPEGMALLLNSQADTTHMQQLDLDIRKINLRLISNLMPYLPELGGLFSANVEYATADSTYHITTQVGIDSLQYEKGNLGNISLNASYLPGEEHSHHLSAHLVHDKREVLTAGGTYYNREDQDSLLSKIKIADLPLWMANAFIPQDMASVRGSVKGEIQVGGHLKAPKINGYLSMDTASVFVNAAATRFNFDSKQVEVVNNRIHFNQFGITTAGKNPFTINGWIDASDPVRMLADLTLSAQNMELINVKRNKQSLVYGKMYVDLSSTVRGPLDALIMRGDIQLLGNTDLTYVLKDSPLTVQDRLSDLVTFVNFADTSVVKKDETSLLRLGGLDMLLTIRIDQAVRLKADLSEDRESRVELEGGGDLSFQYTPQGDMVLSGRYTLSGGLIKYTLPVVPSKTFAIQNGSYVQWSGNAMDPLLNITATESVRTSVPIGDQPPQMVTFNVGISVKNQLEDLSLVFDLSSPDNQAMQTELTAMSSEQRSKQAVTMLVTGMYISENSAGGKMNLDMGNALNSFLQNEINNLAGSALKGVDVSFGVENQNKQEGSNSQKDYSFRFSKRFYNDRIRVIIGGKISTGAPEDQNQSFIDNVSIEYRLDTSGTRYVRLFHNKNYESILEGEVTETGAGIVLRKKMRKLRELFMFKKKKKQEIQPTQK